MRRFYLSADAIQNGEAAICGADAHHIKNVLRSEKGDILQLIVTDGQSYRARIKSFSKNQVYTEIIAQENISQTSDLHITVAQSILKDNKTDTLIRQATELGADRWISFVSERSIVRPNVDRMNKKVKRWQVIARSAAQQCRRLRIPDIHEDLLDISDIFSLISGKETRGFFFWEGSQIMLESNIKPTPRSVILVFGPEGGFSEKEAKHASDSGFMITSLGPRTLRAETATIAGLSIMQYLYGDFFSKKS
ncbi:MAG: 16S rRNA (uracil(1498)-N(3))-methyltransferase [Candidatus Magnetomorum sp.]|nr:16S rRNA (uracil(1498)-N(3))-methyltransferase [Candidatus Magnetomorum sp.]